MHLLIVTLFFFNDTATTEIYTLSLHDALPISGNTLNRPAVRPSDRQTKISSSCGWEGFTSGPWVNPSHPQDERSEEHTSELQSQSNLVCRLLLEKKKSSRVIPICRR